MATLAAAQKPLATKPNGPELFALEDLRPGMKGTARTVFSGSETQEFGVEVLGVLPGFPGPRQSAIIAKLSGANVEKTGVFAGMSGSPVLHRRKDRRRHRVQFSVFKRTYRRDHADQADDRSLRQGL